MTDCRTCPDCNGEVTARFTRMAGFSAAGLVSLTDVLVLLTDVIVAVGLPDRRDTAALGTW